MGACSVCMRVCVCTYRERGEGEVCVGVCEWRVYRGYQE
jgi:hypothetical protein